MGRSGIADLTTSAVDTPDPTTIVADVDPNPVGTDFDPRGIGCHVGDAWSASPTILVRVATRGSTPATGTCGRLR